MTQIKKDVGKIDDKDIEIKNLKATVKTQKDRITGFRDEVARVLELERIKLDKSDKDHKKKVASLMNRIVALQLDISKLKERRELIRDEHTNEIAGFRADFISAHINILQVISESLD